MKKYAEFALAGFLDAFKAWPFSTLLLYKSLSLRKLAFKCLLLNGCLFLGSIFLWDYALLPLINWTVLLVTGENSLPTNFLVKFTSQISTLVYNFFWVWPVYGLSFLLNSIWYQEIADTTFKYLTRPPETVKETKYRSPVSVLADEIYRTLLFSTFLAQAVLVYFVPFIGPFISFIMICWLYAYYSFEYNWIQRKWSLEYRLSHFETHWAYFAGFGFPCTALTFWWPQLVGGGLFALIFPMFIIISFVSVPVPINVVDASRENLDSIRSQIKFPIFATSKYLNFHLIRYVKFNHVDSLNSKSGNKN